MFERITFDPQIMSGRACIRGMRISVAIIMRQIAQVAMVEDILTGYPDLNRTDVQEVLEYAAWLTEDVAFFDILRIVHGR